LGSRKRSKRAKPAPSGTPAQEPLTPPAGDANPAESSPADAAESPRTRRFLLIAAVVAAWWAVLIGLVIWTANPVTLNRRQIRISHLVVTAEVLDADAGQVKILKRWKGNTAGEELRVNGLRDSGAETGEAYILPLTAKNGQWKVTPAFETQNTPSIYPADLDSVKQLEALLANETAQKRQ